MHAAQALPEGRRRGVHLRACLLRSARLAPRRERGAHEPRAHGRAACGGGTGRGRGRDVDSRLGHTGGDRIRQAVGDPVLRRADQEPLRGPDVHRAGSGAARAGRPAQVQPARRVAGQRVVVVDDSIVRGTRCASSSRCSSKPGASRGARSHRLAARRLALLLRHRHAEGERSSRPPTAREHCAPARRLHLARVPVARGNAGATRSRPRQTSAAPASPATTPHATRPPARPRSSASSPPAPRRGQLRRAPPDNRRTPLRAYRSPRRTKC